MVLQEFVAFREAQGLFRSARLRFACRARDNSIPKTTWEQSVTHGYANRTLMITSSLRARAGPSLGVVQPDMCWLDR